MDNLDLILAKQFSANTRDRIIHRYGHELIAQSLGYDIQMDSNSDNHNITILNAPLNDDQNTHLILIYMAGNSAEDIYNKNSKNNNSKESQIRLINDLEHSYKNMIKDITTATEKSNKRIYALSKKEYYEMFMDLPSRIIAEYMYWTTESLEYIAKARCMTSKELMQNRLRVYAAQKINNAN